MARTYELKRSTTMSVEDMKAQQNVEALQRAVADIPRWSVRETANYLGSLKHANRDLAIALLREKFKSDPTPRQISSEMRSVQRWINYEHGVVGKQSRKPSADARARLARVGRNQELAKKGFSIKLDGDIAINGYRRNPRTASVDLEGDLARSFLEQPNYGDLGKAYLGNEDSLYGFGDDLKVDLISE